MYYNNSKYAKHCVDPNFSHLKCPHYILCLSILLSLCIFLSLSVILYLSVSLLPSQLFIVYWDTAHCLRALTETLEEMCFVRDEAQVGTS